MSCVVPGSRLRVLQLGTARSGKQLLHEHPAAHCKLWSRYAILGYASLVRRSLLRICVSEGRRTAFNRWRAATDSVDLGPSRRLHQPFEQMAALDASSTSNQSDSGFVDRLLHRRHGPRIHSIVSEHREGSHAKLVPCHFQMPYITLDTAAAQHAYTIGHRLIAEWTRWPRCLPAMNCAWQGWTLSVPSPSFTLAGHSKTSVKANRPNPFGKDALRVGACLLEHALRLLTRLDFYSCPLRLVSTRRRPLPRVNAGHRWLQCLLADCDLL